MDERGTLVPAVADGTGRLVPNRRAPSFHVPEVGDAAGVPAAAAGWH